MDDDRDIPESDANFFGTQDDSRQGDEDMDLLDIDADSTTSFDPNAPTQPVLPTVGSAAERNQEYQEIHNTRGITLDQTQAEHSYAELDRIGETLGAQPLGPPTAAVSISSNMETSSLCEPVGLNGSSTSTQDTDTVMTNSLADFAAEASGIGAPGPSIPEAGGQNELGQVDMRSRAPRLSPVHGQAGNEPSLSDAEPRANEPPAFLRRRKVNADLLPKLRKMTMQAARGGTIKLRKSRDARKPEAPVRTSASSVQHEDAGMENAWMTEELADDDNTMDETQLYEALRQGIVAKMQAGTATIEDEVELVAAEKRQVTMRKRRNAEKLGPNDQSQEESLFIPETHNLGGARKRARSIGHQGNFDPTGQAADDAVSNSTAKRQRLAPIDLTQTTEPTSLDRNDAENAPCVETEDASDSHLRNMLTQELAAHGKKTQRKKTGPRPKNAREVRQRQREKEAAKKRTKKADKTKVASTQKVVKPRAVSKACKVAKENKSKAQKPPYSSGAATDAAEMLMNLVFNNPIEDRVRQGDFGDAPIIKSERKDRMVAELIASVPEDVNKRQAGSDKKDVLRASKSFGAGRVKAFKGQWKFKGLKTPLYHHQLLGADFMVSREVGDIAPHGGLVADTMGLGKTLEVLATIVGNPPDGSQKGVKTTLVVVPSSALKQWEEEIRRHVQEGFLKKMMHYKRSKEMSMANLEDQDLLITTYSEVVKSYPYPDAAQLKNKDSAGIAGLVQEMWDMRGDLHRIHFYRVVLDEAHAIKNYRSRTSLACVALDADYRWAITGTPIQNRLEELYPYFCFFRLPYTKSLATFKNYFSDPESLDCNQRLSYVLSIFMIRRTLKDRIFGRPLIELPKTHPEVKRIEFSPEERAIYEILEERFRQDINRWFKSGSTQRNYGNMVVRLLRLRQATSHPFLLYQTIRDVFTLEDVRRLEDRLGKLVDSAQFYKKVQTWVTESQTQSDDPPADSNPGMSSGSGTSASSSGRPTFGYNFGFDRYLGTLDEQEMLARCICHICADLADDPQITDCKHVFCKSCIQEACNRSAEAGSDYTECPACRFAFTGAVPHSDLQARKQTSRPGAAASNRNQSSESQSKKRKVPKNEWLDMKGDILPSAKLMAVKAQVRAWLGEAPNDKIIIFTQFHLIAQLLSKVCKNEGWHSVMFTGEMDLKARDKARNEFMEHSNVNIMIAGLKCGGIALNLTAANRVISIDLWWNHSAELQAFGRVFRIGQTKETYLMRYAVRGTVDDRMLAMQYDKTKVIDRAMLDDGQRVAPLSIPELAKLFGFLDEDEDGHPVIVADRKRPNNVNRHNEVADPASNHDAGRVVVVDDDDHDDAPRGEEPADDADPASNHDADHVVVVDDDDDDAPRGEEPADNPDPASNHDADPVVVVDDDDHDDASRGEEPPDNAEESEPDII